MHNWTKRYVFFSLVSAKENIHNQRTFNLASQSVEGTVTIPEPNQSLILECFDTLWCVQVLSLFVLDSPINVLSDWYPVTWLAKVVALLPPVTYSFALCGPYVVLHCHPLELVNLIMDDYQIEAHLMGAGSGSRYFCTRTNKSSLQFRENHPQTITPPPPSAVVPTLCSCGNAVFLGHHTRTRSSTRFKKKRLPSDQCTLCHDLILHAICSRAHWSLDVLWRFVSGGRFIGI